MTGQVSTWMDDHLQAGKPSWYVTASEVNSAFYPLRHGKMSINIRTNGNDGYGLLAAYRRACGSSRLLGPRVGGHLVPCCIHCMNRVNSCNGLPWWQHY